MKNKPVNTIETNGNVIRVNDRTSEIQITLKDINGDNAKITDELEYFYLTNDNKHLYEVTDYSIDNHIITFKMPSLPRGLFRLEIKDSNGIIYPSGDDVEITVNISLEEGINTTYFTYQDIVNDHVEKTALTYIEEHPEKFKGRDGVDGRDGRDGVDGRDGRDGVDGRDGQDGLNGLDGEDGKDGKIEDVSIGVINKIEIDKLSAWGGTTPVTEYEYINGVVHYSGVLGYLGTNILMGGSKYVFRINDYLTNPNYIDGMLLLEIRDPVDLSITYSSRINKKENYIIDFTNHEYGEYNIRIRVSSLNEEFSGFLEKPMLVEGDIPVLWNMSEKDRSIYLESLNKSKYHLSNIGQNIINGTLSNPSIVSLTNINSTQEITDNQITLHEGIWLCSINTYMSPVDFNDFVNLHLYLNNEEILLSQIPSTQLKNKTLTHIFKVEGESQFSLRTSKKAGSDEISFNGTTQNQLNLTRLGGI